MEAAAAGLDRRVARARPPSAPLTRTRLRSPCPSMGPPRSTLRSLTLPHFIVSMVSLKALAPH